KRQYFMSRGFGTREVAALVAKPYVGRLQMVWLRIETVGLNRRSSQMCTQLIPELMDLHNIDVIVRNSIISDPHRSYRQTPQFVGIDAREFSSAGIAVLKIR